MTKHHTTNRASSRAFLTLLAAIATLAIGATAASAQQELPEPLSRALATKLIADFFEMGVNEITIAYIIEGKIKEEGFESHCGARVTFIRPVVQDGRRRRRIASIHFLHDNHLGWFLRATIVNEDGRSYVDICSEHRGRIRVE